MTVHGDNGGERRIGEIAARQYRNITLAQLESCGLRRDAIQYRREIGRLHDVFRGVLAVGTPQDTRLGYLAAATLSVGPDSAVSHFSAGQLYGVFHPRVGAIHVTAPRRLQDRGALKLHRRDVERVAHLGIPTVTIEQTLLDLATCMYSDRAYTRVVREALVQRLTTYERLGAFGDGRPGVARLRAVLATGEFRTRSRLEDEVLAALLAAGVPPPRCNVVVHGFELDLYWPGSALAVEVDGPVHDNPLAAADDARRDAHLARRGIEVVRVTRPETAVAAVGAALHRRGRS